MKLPLLPYSRVRLRHAGMFIFCIVNGVLPVCAEDTGRIDRLTQQWLDTDRQTSHMQSDWQAQRPVLEQRLSLLKAEKAQLLTILQESNVSQSEVDNRRADLLSQQNLLEQQQQALSQTLSFLLSRIEGISTQLPPPLKTSWYDEQNLTGENPEVSMQLQVVLAQLSLLADFDRRIAVHEAPIARADGKKILVKQLYLGVGIAWFVSSDAQFTGWGQAGDDGWRWHIDDNIDAAEVAKAIAIFEKHQQADFVRLPVKLANNFVEDHEVAH